LTDYIKMKRIQKDAVDDFPHKNVIVRALGMKETVAVDVFRKKPRLGDLYLFCSDGLCDMVDDATMLDVVLSEHNLDRCCNRLVEIANTAGGVDNITVTLARFEKAA
ncbi:MAG: serine/threonine-protein phosphatase, partial [Pseudomonadota bacterium]